MKLAPGEGFVLPARRRDVADASVHVDLPRHGRPRPRPSGRHAASSGRAGNRHVAAEAAERSGPDRARAARPAGAAAAGALVAARRVRPRTRRRSVARLRTRRESLRIDGAEIVDDWVSVLDGQRVTRRFRELEVELVGGTSERSASLRRRSAGRARRRPTSCARSSTERSTWRFLLLPRSCLPGPRPPRRSASRSVSR